MIEPNYLLVRDVLDALTYVNSFDSVDEWCDVLNDFTFTPSVLFLKYDGLKPETKSIHSAFTCDYGIELVFNENARCNRKQIGYDVLRILPHETIHVQQDTSVQSQFEKHSKSDDWMVHYLADSNEIQARAFDLAIEQEFDDLHSIPKTLALYQSTFDRTSDVLRRLLEFADIYRNNRELMQIHRNYLGYIGAIL